MIINNIKKAKRIFLIFKITINYKTIHGVKEDGESLKLILFINRESFDTVNEFWGNADDIEF